MQTDHGVIALMLKRGPGAPDILSITSLVAGLRKVWGIQRSVTWSRVAEAVESQWAWPSSCLLTGQTSASWLTISLGYQPVTVWIVFSASDVSAITCLQFFLRSGISGSIPALALGRKFISVSVCRGNVLTPSLHFSLASSPPRLPCLLSLEPVWLLCHGWS